MSHAAAPAAARGAPNLMFSHMGFAVTDLVRMEDVYTRVLGFTVTDRGEVMGMNLVFRSRDALGHHQLAHASGRPEGIPPNPFHAPFGSLINQISCRSTSRSPTTWFTPRRWPCARNGQASSPVPTGASARGPG